MSRSTTPNILIAFATRHGATHEIAETLKETFVNRGLSAETKPVQDVRSLDGYDAVIIGSAVYMGRWMKAARSFVDEHRGDLAGKDVWLFSSGPVGEPADAADEPFGIDEVVSVAHAHAHRIFAGKIDRSELGLAERAVIRMVKAPDGDYRDWDAIRGWAHEIADRMAGRAAA